MLGFGARHGAGEHIRPTAIRRYLFGKYLRVLYKRLSKSARRSQTLMDTLRDCSRFLTEDGRVSGGLPEKVIRSWVGGLKQGGTLSGQMRGWVPDMHVTLVLAGEKSGRLADSLDVCLYFMESGRRIKGSLISSLVSPAILFVALWGLLLGLVFGMVPIFESMVDRDQWQGAGGVLDAVATFVEGGLIFPFLGGGAVLFFVVYKSLGVWRGGLRDRLSRMIPPYNVYQRYYGAGFFLALSSLIETGTGNEESINLLMQDANPWYRSKLAGILRQINQGHGMGEAMFHSDPYWPTREGRLEVQMLAGFKDFGQDLKELGDEWIEGSIDYYNRVGGALKNGMLLIVAGSIGFILVAVKSIIDQVVSSV